MIIPMPRFEPVPANYSGLSFLGKIKKAWKTPPSFRLIENWLITLDDGLQLIFPEGFVTDFASVPRLFWIIPGFSPYGPLLLGAVPHDFGFQHGYFLTKYDPQQVYSIKSMQVYAEHRDRLGDMVPVFIGRKQVFFDNLLEGLTIEATGARFVASVAKKILGKFGNVAWHKYRKKGPGAFGKNSLNLPGVNLLGEVRH